MASKKNDKSESELLLEISQKLSKLIAINSIQGKDKDSQVKILTSEGFTNAEISSLLGIPKGTVDSIRAKKEKVKKKTP